MFEFGLQPPSPHGALRKGVSLRPSNGRAGSPTPLLACCVTRREKISRKKKGRSVRTPKGTDGFRGKKGRSIRTPKGTDGSRGTGYVERNREKRINCDVRQKNKCQLLTLLHARAASSHIWFASSHIWRKLHTKARAAKARSVTSLFASSPRTFFDTHASTWIAQKSHTQLKNRSRT